VAAKYSVLALLALAALVADGDAADSVVQIRQPPAFAPLPMDTHLADFWRWPARYDACTLREQPCL
jgi:hypothetical protein